MGRIGCRHSPLPTPPVHPIIVSTLFSTCGRGGKLHSIVRGATAKWNEIPERTQQSNQRGAGRSGFVESSLGHHRIGIPGGAEADDGCQRCRAAGGCDTCSWQPGALHGHPCGLRPDALDAALVESQKQSAGCSGGQQVERTADSHDKLAAIAPLDHSEAWRN